MRGDEGGDLAAMLDIRNARAAFAELPFMALRRENVRLPDSVDGHCRSDAR
jgi:hypothetical protein